MDDGPALGLYIHIPFCQAKCLYCDFNSYPGLDSLFGDYAAALVCEIGQAVRTRVATVYVGGGTPTVLPLPHLASILEAARRAFAVDADAEISLEANPGTVDAAKLAGLRALGVNRLSLGIQSFDDRELRLLGRIHSAAEAAAAFQAARQAGFRNVNLDLLYGLPRQPLASWRASLERALDLQPDHLSLYAITVEPGTPLATAIARGQLPAADPDRAADMYELAQGLLAASSYVHYEISNWARGAEFQCQHNLIYWRNEPYLGVGAGAHSWLDGRRWSNTSAPAAYVAQVQRAEQPVAGEETIDRELQIGETMMLGLRLLEEGVSFERFRRRFGLDLDQCFAGELADLGRLGLLDIDGERVRLSARGRLLGNQVFLRFLPDRAAEG
jgi:oxygen-independent coproporphyrinogen-3 oxidase